MISKIKKTVSILLSLIMVFSMFAIVPLSASAAVGDTVPESEYLTFTAEEAGSSVTLKYTKGTLKYNKNNSGWEDYTNGAQITLASAGDSVRFCGTGTTFNSSNHVTLTGKVACSGNVMSLRLDDNGRDQGLSYSCFSNMFYGCAGLTAAPELPETTLADSCYSYMFYGCTNLTAAPELPATALAESCYSSMFCRCTSLTTAPELPATTLARYCYSRMFYRCTRLTTAPELPATALAESCYSFMFTGCSSIKLSETQTAEYSIPYSVPSGGNGTTASNALTNMFGSTGGTFTGTPEINKIYYRPAEKYTVTWKNEDGTTLKTDTDVAEGTTPTYDGETPEKAEDADNTYTFSGWSPEVTAVTGDVTYTATFTATAKPKPWTYNITTGGEYTCPSTLSQYTTVSGGTEDNPVVINITGQTSGYPIHLKSGYLKIVGNNNTFIGDRGFVFFSELAPNKPNGEAHLTVTDLTIISNNATNQYIQISSQNYKCQSTFENVTFKNCNINGSGAVVIGSETTHTFKNCTFEDITGYNAGGISVRYGSDVTMEGCTFKNCTRTRPYSTSFLGGGAVWVEEDTKLTLDDCTFEGCTGKCGAVGIENTATLTLKGNTTITGNQDGNLYLPTGATFKISDDFTGTVGVTTQTAPTDSASVTLSSDLADTQAALANKNIVSDNENYAVSYDSNKLFLVVPATYTVTWKNWDGSVLKTDENVAAGSTPTYDGTTPYKADGANCIYTFSGWTPEVSAVTGDATYTAQFTESEKPETIKDCNNKYGNFRLYSNVPIVSFSNVNDLLTGAIIPITYGDSNTMIPVQDAKGYTYKFYDQTGTEIPAQIADSSSEPGSNYELSDDVTVYTNVINFTRPAGCTAIYIVATAPAPAPAKLILHVGENGKVVMDNGTFGNATDASNITEVPAPINVADGSKVFIVDDHTANLVEGGSINIATGGELSFYPSAGNTGVITAIPDEGYVFVGWYNGNTLYSSGAALAYQNISEDITLTAKFERELFWKHSVTLGGDIGVNFYLNPAVLDTYTGAKTVTFTWDGNEITVDVPATATADGYKVTCNVVAAQMAHKIHAVVKADGTALAQTDDYSVQDYAETVYANPAAYDSEKPEQLKAVAEALLHYGAMAQTVFAGSLEETPDHLADVNMPAADFSGATAENIAAAIKGSASDLDAAAAAFDAEFYTSSLIYLSRNTLRLYFTPASKTVGALNGLDFSGNLSEYYYYVDVENIAAAELDNQQTFSVNGTEFTFSALDYAKAVVESTKMEPEQKNLAKSLYLYNMTANDYFDGGSEPEPVELFTKVTDANQIAEDNIGECTFEEAKAWVLANWDDVMDTEHDVDVVYFDGTDLKCFSIMSNMSKQQFEEMVTSGAEGNVNIGKLKYWFSSWGDDIYLCSN